jgi:hypothetical protein
MQHAHLLSRKQTFGPQPVIATLQIKGPPDMTNFLEVERCVLPSLSTLLVQNLGHFAITVLIQELIDLGDDLRLGLPNLGNGQRLRHAKTSSGAAAEAYMNLDLRMSGKSLKFEI